MPLRVVLVLAILLALPPTAGHAPVLDADCDGVPDELDAWIAPECGPPPWAPGPRVVRVQFVLVAPTADASAAALDDLAPPLSASFEGATRGLVEMQLTGPALVVTARSVEQPWSVASRVPTDADIIVLVTSGGVALADASCACVAWNERALSPTPVGPRAIVGLARLDELTDVHEVEYRFLHEVAHAWCCRVAPDAPSDLRDAGTAGEHWPLGATGIGTVGTDPLIGDGSQGHAYATLAYTDATLVTMRALDPAQARPLRLPDGKLLSGTDVAALLT